METISNNSWLCKRCYRPNFAPDSDEHCIYGCGYSIDDKLYNNFEWSCPICKEKNVSELFTTYCCYSCKYILNLNDYK